MTIGVYSNVIQQLTNRIYEAKDTLGIEHIQLMTKPERLQCDMTPYVLITPDPNFINEDYGRSVQQNRKTGTINLVIWCAYPIKNRDGQNNYYDSARIIDNEFNDIVDGSGIFLISSEGTTGALPFLEGLLDALNTDGSTLNPQIQDSALSMSFNIQNFIKHEQTVEFEILVSVETTYFSINNRERK